MASFLSLPGEIRNMIYSHLVVCEEPIDPFLGGAQLLFVQILRTNKTIFHESSSLLYTQNCFDFRDLEYEDIDKFFNQIGRYNAVNIRYICVLFPQIYDTIKPLILEDDSARILAKIQNYTTVRRLILAAEGTALIEYCLNASASSKAFAKALCLLNDRLRTIPSLQEIVVQVYVEDDASTSHVIKELKSIGWTVDGIELEEDLFSPDSYNVEDDDHGYDEYPDEDNYDIDNDSDFWRRAAD